MHHRRVAPIPACGCFLARDEGKETMTVCSGPVFDLEVKEARAAETMRGQLS